MCEMFSFGRQMNAYSALVSFFSICVQFCVETNEGHPVLVKSLCVASIPFRFGSDFFFPFAMKLVQFFHIVSDDSLAIRNCLSPPDSMKRCTANKINKNTSNQHQ